MSLTELVLSLELEDRPLVASIKVLKYPEDSGSEDLERELPKRHTKESTLFGEIARRLNLEYIIFHGVTDYEAVEEITRQGMNGKHGYLHYQYLACLLSGRKLSGKAVKDYFINLVKEDNMPQLAERNKRYVDAFDIEYVKGTTKKELRARIPLFQKPVRKPDKYNPFLKALHQKVKGNKPLQYEFLKKWTGIGTEDQLTYRGTEEIAGYSKLKSMAAFFTGKVMGEEETGKYLKGLLRTKGQKIDKKGITDIIMAFKDDIRHIYAARTIVSKYAALRTSEQVREELLLHLTGRMKQVSQKIRKLGLQFIIFQAATGYETQNDIRQKGTNRMPGYSSLTALGHLLTGKTLGVTGTGRYFRELAMENGMR